MAGHDLDTMDGFALEMNQGVEPGDERHYHAESIDTPLMMPAGGTNQWLRQRWWQRKMSQFVEKAVYGLYTENLNALEIFNPMNSG